MAFRQDCTNVVFGDGQAPHFTPTPIICGEPGVSMNNGGVAAIRNAYDQSAGRFSDQILLTNRSDLLLLVADQVGNGLGTFNEWSINDRNEVAFDESHGLVWLAHSEPNPGSLTRIAGPGTQTPFGPMSAARLPAINGNGAVAFRADFAPPNPGSRLFLDDGKDLIELGSAMAGVMSLNHMNQVALSTISQILVVDAGPTPRAPTRVVAAASPTFTQVQQPSLNGNGTVAFMATFNTAGSDHGIFTGSDAVANKVVRVGDRLLEDVIPGGVVVRSIGLSSEGINDRGQIAFSALTDHGQFVLRADPPVLEPLPPGMSADNPRPPSTLAYPWAFHVRRARVRTQTEPCPAGWQCGWEYIDPPVATGYSYSAGMGAANFAAVLVPKPLPGGDDTFELEFAGTVHKLTAGVPFDITQTIPEGVNTFTIRGIDAGENLDPNNPLAFVTGLMWVDGFDGEIFMTPLTTSSDSTPPSISAQVSGTQGQGGWYAGDVSVSWGVDEPESPESVETIGCGNSVINVDTPGQVVTCQATSTGGSATESVTVKRDATKPTVTYNGNTGNYDLFGTVAITCAAADNLAGVASSTCTNANGPAWTFGVGSHVLSAQATDAAGNVGSGSSTFVVSISGGSLCGLTQQFVAGSARYQSLTTRQRAAVNALTGALCDSLARIVPRLNASQKAAFVRAYRVGVDALFKDGWLTEAQRKTLQDLAGAL